MKAMNRLIWMLSAGLGLALPLLLGTAGCQVPKGVPSDRLAAIVVTNRPLAAIEEATETVFRENGFATARHLPGEFVFEKKGTEGNTLVYGDWSEKAVWVRVKLYIRRLGSTPQFLVECDVYMVNDHGDVRFEEEHKLTRMHHGRWQKLLEEIGQRLK
jgi:hypothetical protein